MVKIARAAVGPKKNVHADLTVIVVASSMNQSEPIMNLSPLISSWIQSSFLKISASLLDANQIRHRESGPREIKKDPWAELGLGGDHEDYYF